MKRPYVIAALVVVAEVVATAAILLAPYLVVLAVPWLAGAALGRKHLRAGAAVVVPAAVLVIALTVSNLLGQPDWKDVQFDVVAGIAALVALADATRALLFGNRVTALAHH